MDELTIGELSLLLDPPRDGKPPVREGAVALGPHEMIAWAARVRGLSLRERLDRAKRG